jgi:hypothetical protein
MQTKYLVISLLSLLLAMNAANAQGMSRSTTVIPPQNIFAPSNMSSPQFDTFVTKRWDTNGDGIVSRSEWDRGAPSWFGSHTVSEGTFRTWDENNNGILEPTEMQGFFSTSGLFPLYDRNGDGVIDSSEAAAIPH